MTLLALGHALKVGSQILGLWVLCAVIVLAVFVVVRLPGPQDEDGDDDFDESFVRRTE